MNLDLSLEFAVTETASLPQPPYRLYRVKHDIELGELWRNDLPEVFPLDGSLAVKMTSDWQQLAYDLYRYSASNVDEETAKKRWRIIYGYRTAFTNNQGFEKPGDPRADYINNKNLDMPLPKWDKTRVCGGATISGYKDNGKLVVTCLDATKTAPSLYWLLDRFWLWFTAVNVSSKGSIYDFPQGDGRPVYTPLVSKGQEVRIDLALLEELPIGARAANPYWIP